jgi:hypothetical protein
MSDDEIKYEIDKGKTDSGTLTFSGYNSKKYKCRKCEYVGSSIGWQIWDAETNLKANFCIKCTTDFLVKFFDDNEVGRVDEVKE